MQQYANTLADGSGASLQDKAAAYAGITRMWGDVGGWYDQSSPDQRQYVTDTFNNSSFSKQVQAATSQFNAEGVADVAATDAGSPSFDPTKMEYYRFLSLPADQQLLVYAGNSDIGSFNDYVSFLKQQVDVATQDAAQQGGQSSVTVTLSDTAKTALAASKATDAASDPASQALKTLTSAPPADSDADVALTMLKSAAKAAASSRQTTGDKEASAAASKANADQSASAAATTTTSAYQAGGVVSVTA
jgi:hypothetical protein